MLLPLPAVVVAGVDDTALAESDAGSGDFDIFDALAAFVFKSSVLFLALFRDVDLLRACSCTGVDLVLAWFLDRTGMPDVL